MDQFEKEIGFVLLAIFGSVAVLCALILAF